MEQRFKEYEPKMKRKKRYKYNKNNVKFRTRIQRKYFLDFKNGIVAMLLRNESKEKSYWKLTWHDSCSYYRQNTLTCEPTVNTLLYDKKKG